jgi:hypothetical protein
MARISRERSNPMKTLTTILAAAFIAGSAGLAMAQGSGGGAAGGDQTQQGTMKDADKNPTGAGANPQAGNTDAKSQGSAKTGATTGTTGGAMQTAPVSGTPKKDSSTPAQAPTSDKK